MKRETAFRAFRSAQTSATSSFFCTVFDHALPGDRLLQAEFAGVRSLVKCSGRTELIPRPFPQFRPDDSVPPGNTSTAPSVASRLAPPFPAESYVTPGRRWGSSAGSNGPGPHLMAIPPGPNLVAGIYNHSYDSASASPAAGQLGDQFSDVMNSSLPGTPGQPQAQLTSASLQAQKRAYRQRRKDPSCDACRERKVKVNSLANPGSDRRRLLIVLLVRCHGSLELFGMSEPECQMSVYERDEQENVVDQVLCPPVPFTAPDVF